MKRFFLFFCVFTPFFLAARETPVVCDFPEPDEPAMEVSAAYDVSALVFSFKHLPAQSILSWRDVFLHGSKVNVGLNIPVWGFDKMNIGAGFSRSFSGYCTDDDVKASSDSGNYPLPMIGFTDSTVTVVDVLYELTGKNDVFTKKIGVDVSWLNFENYGILYLNKNGEDYAIAGQNTNAYNVIRLGAYGGLAMTLIKSGPFYLNLGGHTGLGMLLGLANWKINTNFKKPLSFLDIGFTFRGGGELELGFKIRQITLFLAIQASYEISPLIFDVVFLSNGQNGYGIGYTDISRASARTGAKIAF